MTMTTTWLVLLMVVFAGVFVFSIMTRWAGSATAGLQKRILSDMEPWTEAERLKYNASVVLHALLMALAFTFATWAIGGALMQV